MSAGKMDEHLLSTLDENELAAINDEEYNEQEKAALAKLAAEAGDDDDNDDGDDEGVTNEGNGQPVEGKGAADAGDDTKTPKQPDPVKDKAKPGAQDDAQGDPQAADDKQESGEDEDQVKPTAYKAELPADFKEQVKAITDAKKELNQKFEDGDINAAEYTAELEQLNEQKAKLDKIQFKAELSEEMEEQTARNEWQRTINTFMKQAKASGLDYTAQENAELQRQLDIQVRALGSDPKNADKSMAWFLQTADKAVRAINGLEMPKAQSKDNVDPIAKARASRKPPVDAVPSNLSQVPGADGDGDIGGEFADLDALEGEALEAAIRKLSPAQLEKYKAGL